MAIVNLFHFDPETPEAGIDMAAISVAEGLFWPWSPLSYSSTHYNGYDGDDEIGAQGWFTGSKFQVDWMYRTLTAGLIESARYEWWVQEEFGERYYRTSYDIQGFAAPISLKAILELPDLQVLKRVLRADDQVTGTGGDDILVGYGGDDRLDGEDGSDTLDGGIGNDWLAGRNGDDILKGRDGNDTLIGGRGRDLYYGGEGQDTFVSNSILDSVLGARRDVIQDFQTGVDKLDLSRIDANGDPSDGDQALVWIGSSNFTYAGQVRFADGILQINTDDNLHADFQLRIKGAFDGADLIV